MPQEVSTFRVADPARWRATAHPLGRGRFEPANVAYGPGGASLRLPPGRTDGGELEATSPRGDGIFGARLRASDAPGSLSAFFLYRHDDASDTSDELDIEIPAGEPYRVMVTIWNRGIPTPADHNVVELGFDPSASLHDYVIERRPRRVRFFVDGRCVMSSVRAPGGLLTPMFNAWYPQWLEPAAPPEGGELQVGRFAFTSP